MRVFNDPIITELKQKKIKFWNKAFTTKTDKLLK